MIRRATIDDLPSILRMSEDFHQASPYRNIPFNKEFLAQNVQAILINPLFSLFVAEDHNGNLVGMLAGVITQKLFSPEPAAGELVWWVDPEYRSNGIGPELHQSFQAWAISKGCSSISMVLLEDENLELIDKMYKNMGYTPTERSYATWQQSQPSL